MTKLVQIKSLLGIYIMMICKINNKNKNIISNIDQYNNYLSFLDNSDIHKLIH